MKLFTRMRIRMRGSKVTTQTDFDPTTRLPISTEVIGRSITDVEDYDVDVSPLPLVNEANGAFSRDFLREIIDKDLRSAISPSSHSSSLAVLFGDNEDGSPSKLNEMLGSGQNLQKKRDCKVMKDLAKVSAKAYSLINPITNEVDVSEDSMFAPTITLAIHTGAMGTQKDEDGNEYFNPMGTVSVAEFLEVLSSFRGGSTRVSTDSTNSRSIDHISDAEDFFNNGYNACLSGVSSPFYRLYDRQSLRRPITRAELAYITVVCWSIFRKKYGDVMTSGKYPVGCNVDWNAPQKYVRRFNDTASQAYRVYKKCTTISEGIKVLSVDLKSYHPNITDLISNMKKGKKGIPLPMFMSLIELSALSLFPFENSNGVSYMFPLREVSREELSYFAVQLARTFPERRIG